jgi:hypothetical protein
MVYEFQNEPVDARGISPTPTCPTDGSLSMQ